MFKQFTPHYCQTLILTLSTVHHFDPICLLRTGEPGLVVDVQSAQETMKIFLPQRRFRRLVVGWADRTK